MANIAERLGINVKKIHLELKRWEEMDVNWGVFARNQRPAHNQISLRTEVTNELPVARALHGGGFKGNGRSISTRKSSGNS